MPPVPAPNLPQEARTPQGQEPHAPQGADGADDALEIEIVEPGEEGAQPEAQDPPEAEPAAPAAPASAQQQPPKGPKRPRSDPQRRIDQLTSQKHAAETTAERLFRENEQLRMENEKRAREKQESDTRAAKGERIAAEHYAAGLKAQRELQERTLKEAIATGDVDKQGTATAEMARIAAEEQSTRSWLAANPEPAAPAPVEREPAPPAPAPRRPEAPEQRQFNPAPALEPWIAENPWFDPRTDGYDQEMHLAAATYAASLERRLVAAGKQNEIATPAYFQKISTFVKNEFPDYGWEGDPAALADPEDLSAVTIPAVHGPNRLTPPAQRQNGRPAAPQARIPQMSRNPSVLPVNNAGAAPAAAPRATRVELSADEKQQAVMNWQAGNTGKHYKTQKPIANEREAVEQFAYRKMQNARNGAQ